MNNKGQYSQLVEEADFLLAERRHLRARGVHLIVIHLDHIRGTICAPGEMIGGIYLGGREGPIPLGLSHGSLLLMDCLCRYRMPLTASRIEQIMNSDSFYVDYAANRIGNDQIVARPDSRTVRVYVSRIRKRMNTVFQEHGLRINPRQILTSDATDSNVVVYRLIATIDIIHKQGP